LLAHHPDQFLPDLWQTEHVIFALCGVRNFQHVLLFERPHEVKVAVNHHPELYPSCRAWALLHQKRMIKALNDLLSHNIARRKTNFNI
jgi:hypothetical protein